jgi:hypothetical protein
MSYLLNDPLAMATDGTFSLVRGGGGTAAPPVVAVRLETLPRARSVNSVPSAKKVCPS